MHDRKDIYQKLHMDEFPNVSEFSTETLTVTDLFIGNDVRSPFYQKIIGFFTYKNNNYKFLYDRNHRNISELHCLIQKTTHRIPYEVEKETDFGIYGCWDYTLEELRNEFRQEDVELKQLINKLKDRFA